MEIHFQKAILPIMDKAGARNDPLDIPRFLVKIVRAFSISFDYTTKFKILDLMKMDNQK